jgi:hypothetical protein
MVRAWQHGGRGGVAPLTVAVICHQPAIVNVLLAQDADPNASDGEAPLIRAAQDGPEIVRALIAHGADVNAKNMIGATPLIQAVAFRRPVVVKLLLTHGADVNAKEYSTGQPKTALTLARESLSDARKEGRFDEASDYATIVRLLRETRAKE